MASHYIAIVVEDETRRFEASLIGSFIAATLKIVIHGTYY